MSDRGAQPDGLIETLLWTRGNGFFLREGHEARLKNSAAALGFPFSEAAWLEALAQACVGAEADRLRVRLVLRRDGGYDVAAVRFTPDPPEKIWRVAVAAQKFESRDPLLRHKTTRRDLYEDALTASGADEVIFLNERDEICEGARANIFVERDGALLTPPLASGLLPGVLRAHLLARGRAREKILRLDDLRENFLLGNSLRGLLQAQRCPP